jgi:hypothetical protein
MKPGDTHTDARHAACAARAPSRLAQYRARLWDALRAAARAERCDPSPPAVRRRAELLRRARQHVAWLRRTGAVAERLP